MPGYFLNDFGYALDTIRRPGLPQLKLQYDIWRRQILHGDILKSLEQMMPWIGHIQIASVPKRNEPITEKVNDLLVFEAVDALDSQGYVGCEYRPAKGTLAGLAWLKTAGV